MKVKFDKRSLKIIIALHYFNFTINFTSLIQHQILIFHFQLIIFFNHKAFEANLAP